MERVMPGLDPGIWLRVRFRFAAPQVVKTVHHSVSKVNLGANALILLRNRALRHARL
jgi:hypothetical protein